MPPCFDKWCKKFDDLLRTKAQKREFRQYVGGLLGESERKNLSQMARDAVEVTYHKLHHCLERRVAPTSLRDFAPFGCCVAARCFGSKSRKRDAWKRKLPGKRPLAALHRFLTEATWSASKINERRLIF